MRKDLMAAALGAAVDLLWDTATYTPSAGGPRTISAWLGSADEYQENFGQRAKRSTHVARLRKADVPELAAGDHLVQDGITYRVLADIQEVFESPLEQAVPLEVVT